MLTRGNRKLGDSLIWSFSLPSGTLATCPGLTPTCRTHCYAVALERYRPAAAHRYRRNLQLSQQRDFARHVRAFLIVHHVRVVRVHVSGDFYSRRYAKAWFLIMRKSPGVQFYFYTRSWSIPGIKRILDQMATLPNCRAWFSFDRDTGVPTDVPSAVRLAWLATSPEDRPPANTNLVFRIRRLRSLPVEADSPAVCPTELPSRGPHLMTCERCGDCWRPNPTDRTPLPLVHTTLQPSQHSPSN